VSELNTISYDIWYLYDMHSAALRLEFVWINLLLITKTGLIQFECILSVQLLELYSFILIRVFRLILSKHIQSLHNSSSGTNYSSYLWLDIFLEEIWPKNCNSNLTHISTFVIHHFCPVIQPPSFKNPHTSINIPGLHSSSDISAAGMHCLIM